MKHYIIEGNITNPEKINDHIMSAHIAYSQKAMDKGLILTSGLKEDMSGGLFMMKGESLAHIEEYLENEPLKVNNIQEYRIIGFTPHYFNQNSTEWFNK